MSALLPELALTGLALWTPGYTDPRRLAAGDADPAITAPKATLLPARLRRRCSLLTRMTAEVAARAADQAGIVIAEATLVLGSVYGEILTTGELLDALADDPAAALSPTRFHNSVHNTPIGYLSIACEHRGPATALSAGPQTLAMALLEGASAAASTGAPVIVVVAEEPLPPVLAGDGGEGNAHYPPLAVAFALEVATARSARPGPRLRLRRAAPGPTDSASTKQTRFSLDPCAHVLEVAVGLGLGPEAPRLPPLGPADHDGAVWVLERRSPDPEASR